ncbi:hypothetical protein CROQUDRAFT_92249 [Cronartium quercuum f. sp. fusiforme G11]|uniref:Uncharacterized protein n=1 Tax=Cronartium quercuum f. sp. fusiforme G11 TaxID=708437 RepID=A0A9P6TCH7_9BASI|nr:hypothetical protein CROQUDRAFT_92249 [Cronartium quercuum f. sp. fusiforme G11]
MDGYIFVSSSGSLATLDTMVPHTSDLLEGSDPNRNNGQASPHQNQCLVGFKESKRRLTNSAKTNTKLQVKDKNQECAAMLLEQQVAAMEENNQIIQQMLEKDSVTLQSELTILATNKSTSPDKLAKQALWAMKQKIKEKYELDGSRDIASTISSNDTQGMLMSSQNPSIPKDLLGLF